jgi:chromate reductase, NAD(P)H dehydrogenase (quinone)
MKQVLALCGSLRKTSMNMQYILAVKEIAKDNFNIFIYDGLGDLPHFNPDLENETPPPEVKRFRSALRNADGLLICTPEYAMGVPGFLKNAIDWTVSSMEFSHKPVALITASSMGEKGHASLLETLKIIEADIPEEQQLLISHAKTKIDREGKIKDEAVKKQLEQMVAKMSGMIGE